MVRQGESQLAATLIGAASALTSDEGPDSGAASPELATLAADLDAIRDALGEDVFTAAWDAGRALSLEADAASWRSGLVQREEAYSSLRRKTGSISPARTCSAWNLLSPDRETAPQPRIARLLRQPS
jgi:hypothetical protein